MFTDASPERDLGRKAIETDVLLEDLDFAAEVVPKGTLAERLLRQRGQVLLRAHLEAGPERDLGRKAIETGLTSGFALTSVLPSSRKGPWPKGY